MRHWTLLGEAPVPGTGQVLSLHRDKDNFYIHVSGRGELMNTRRHGSEDALGRLPCRRLKSPKDARVLIGGLGMGFTLAAALGELGENAVVTVAELIPEVVEWNRGELGEASAYPLEDPRTRVYLGDVAELIKKRRGYFDVISLDVDNGPEGMTQSDNDWLYTTSGIAAARDALKAGGILAYWSAGRAPAFLKRLRQCGFRVEERMVRAHGNKGPRHFIWLASLR
jgi:spermidine synthase